LTRRQAELRLATRIRPGTFEYPGTPYFDAGAAQPPSCAPDRGDDRRPLPG
jgi:hypothetical protein